MAVQFGGLVSGLNTNQMISQLVAIERQPINKLNTTKRTVESDIRRVGEMSTRLKALESAAKELGTLEGFMSFKGSSTNEEAVRVSADSGATESSFDVGVSRLAKPARMRSDAFAEGHTFSATTMNIEVFGEDDVELNIPDGASLTEVRDMIRASSAEVDATIINTPDGAHLSITSKKTGHTPGGDPASALTVSGLNMTSVQTAQNALMTVDGVSVESSSNTVSTAVEGVTFELLGEAEGVRAGVAPDREAILEKVKTFVEAYNSTVDAIRSQSNGGNRRRFEADLSEAVTQTAIDGPFVNLRSVGISSGATGKLELDETEFFDRLEENSAALAEVFSSQGGVAAKLTAQVQRYTGGSGILSGIEDSLKSQSDTIDSQIERKERSIETFESRLRRQFSTLEQLLSSLNDQSASFASLVPPSYQSNR